MRFILFLFISMNVLGSQGFEEQIEARRSFPDKACYEKNYQPEPYRAGLLVIPPMTYDIEYPIASGEGSFTFRFEIFPDESNPSDIFVNQEQGLCALYRYFDNLLQECEAGIFYNGPHNTKKKWSKKNYRKLQANEVSYSSLFEEVYLIKLDDSKKTEKRIPNLTREDRSRIHIGLNYLIHQVGLCNKKQPKQDIHKVDDKREAKPESLMIERPPEIPASDW